MSRNPLIDAAVDTFSAIDALRLKRHRLVSTAEGVEIHQPGKPVLILTYAAARAFNQMIEEAGQ